MNPFPHMSFIIDVFEKKHISLYGFVGELSASINAMSDSYDEKNELRSHWGTLELVNAVMLDNGAQTMSPEEAEWVHEAVANIKQILANLTEVTINFIDDSTALYGYGKRQMKIRVEKIPDGVILDADTIRSWLPPYEKELISDSEKELIQKLISGYFDKHNIVYGWI